MKLIIQIPCYNEEETLAIALAELPREVEGFDTVEWLIIDDGCTDRTVEVAKANGVNHVVRLARNQGLARGFMAGLERCIALGADVIVNTDADNQYCAADIPALVKPILNHEADLVVGQRPIHDIEHFSWVKKQLQSLGSWAVRKASNTDVGDAPSGFRAMSRDLAKRLNVFNEYTYTLETIIQAGQTGMAVACVPVRVNEDLRPSRLVKSISSYVRRSMGTIGRIFMTYRPLRFFAFLGSLPFGLGFLLGLRFAILFLMGEGGGKVQSLILASMLMMLGFMLVVVGLLSDLISVNRRLLERVNNRVRDIDDRLTKLATPQ